MTKKFTDKGKFVAWNIFIVFLFFCFCILLAVITKPAVSANEENFDEMRAYWKSHEEDVLDIQFTFMELIQEQNGFTGSQLKDYNEKLKDFNLGSRLFLNYKETDDYRVYHWYNDYDFVVVSSDDTIDLYCYLKTEKGCIEEYGLTLIYEPTIDRYTFRDTLLYLTINGYLD